MNSTLTKICASAPGRQRKGSFRSTLLKNKEPAERSSKQGINCASRLAYPIISLKGCRRKSTKQAEKMQTQEKQFEDAAILLRGARKIVALTGAGISTESGIPDFRSPGSTWLENPPVNYPDFISKPEA